MPFTFTIDTSESIIYIHGVGAIRADDIHVLLDDLTTSELSCMPLLIDLRDATIRFFLEEIEVWVEHRVLHQTQYGATHSAVIASDHASYGVLYMYQSLSAGRDPGFKIFLNLPRALDWLQQKRRY